jgi:4-hydroxybenzoate polyprenyltransferase
MALRSTTLRGLLAACHLGPTMVVTGVITALAVSLGQDALGSLAVLLATLAGQLSIGWANDAHDAEVDRRGGRIEKPVVRGWVSERTVWTAAAVAALLCVPLSLVAGGPIGGTAHIVAVASAWAYDVWLKTTLWSFLPFLLSFALVAPFLTYGLSPPRPPEPWAMAALALIGVGAHLANGIPDIDSDRSSDTQGVVGRLGRTASAYLSVAALLVVTALVLANLALPAGVSVAILVITAIASAVAALASEGRHLFTLVMVLAVANTVLLTVNAGTVAGS